MIIIPWLVFVAACALMIWKGAEAKKQHLCRKAEEEKAQKTLSRHLANQLGSYMNAEKALEDELPKLGVGQADLGHIPRQKPYQA
jgi:hypothetical protein